MAVPEPDLYESEAALARLPPPQQRIALSLLGTALGDSVGLPFELSVHAKERALLDSVLHWQRPATPKVHQDGNVFLGQTIRDRLKRNSIFNRAYSDDTVVTDLKMQAVALADRQLGQMQGAGQAVGSEAAGAALFEALAGEYLAWAYGAEGHLFQGYGGYTKDFLKASDTNRFGALFAHTWPWVEGRENFVATPQYMQFLHEHFSGVGSREGGPSWGNGAVMSFTPGAALRQMRNLVSSGRTVLASSHQAPSALAAGVLLDELLGKIHHGDVADCSRLGEAVLGCDSWRRVLLVTEDPITGREDPFSYMYPLAPFQEFLRHGEASPESVNLFLDSLHGRARDPLRGNDRFGLFGELLRTASNYDDVAAALSHGATAADLPLQLTREERSMATRELKETSRLRVKGRPDEAVRFSQRGLNSLIIAIWAAHGARNCWDWLERVLYCGGDTDTIGSVAGQIACPLLSAMDVVLNYGQFVALDEAGATPPACRLVNHAAARRFFHRSLLFAGGRWDELLQTPRLVDPEYAGLTDLKGTRFAAGLAPPRVSCKHGGRCYDQSAKHRDTYAHPGDADFVAPAAAARMQCRHQGRCYDSSQRHREQYSHPGDPDYVHRPGASGASRSGNPDISANPEASAASGKAQAKDVHGKWWDVQIVAEYRYNDTVDVMVLDGFGTMWNGISRQNVRASAQPGHGGHRGGARQ